VGLYVVSTVLTASLQSCLSPEVESNGQSIPSTNTAIAAPTVAPSNTGRHFNFYEVVATSLSIADIVPFNACFAKANRTELSAGSSSR
jgi:hypothetical protein